MLHVHEHIFVQASRTDPTKTIVLRRRYERDLVRRFQKLKKLIREFLEGGGIVINEPVDELAKFEDWLRRMVEQEILEVSFGTPMQRAARSHWSNMYLSSAYQKGLSHAAQQIRKGGGEVSQEWIDAGFFRPIHADRVGIIHAQSFSKLKGLSEATMDTIFDTLAQGMAEGRSPKQIARMIADRVDAVGIKRARVIARTEVIRAHAQATLNTYKEAGVEGVKVQVEFTTAQDNAVCPRCQELEGKVYTIEEAEGVIPVHPNCRCAWLPVVDAEGVVLE